MFNFCLCSGIWCSATLTFSIFYAFDFNFHYFLLFVNKTTTKKYKEHKALLDSIKRGDQILTSGGVICRSDQS